ncbi:MAG TPA: hypothetical protein PKK57_09610 [Verrucomicrobiota bacterium]|jgi:hypothetical protein|nr:hypothetical protein [Verrucomicrobiota bacterium]HOY60040.1 hypothetical protein [Verrucomicrobiota bacterium]HPV10596.1 hypothetical protein [Verrucomicrobiota bacterium]
MNTDEIKIEKGVPLPPAKAPGNRYGCWVDVIRRMEIGDSIVVPAPAMSSIYPSCKRNGWKIRTQSQPFQRGDKIARLRVWLVAVLPNGHQTNQQSTRVQ